MGALKNAMWCRSVSWWVGSAASLPCMSTHPAGLLMCSPLPQALGEPLYRVSTGNYEYRLILRCRQEARARFSQMRKDVLEKMELLDQKHGEGSRWALGAGEACPTPALYNPWVWGMCTIFSPFQSWENCGPER